MFKLVVLCTVLAAAAAEPSVGIVTPLAYTSTLVAPATTTITRQASSVVHPSPLLYSAPIAYTHFIKKRSAPLALSSYIAPTTYISTPLTTTYTAPFVHATPIISTPLTQTIYPAAHLIKKRSAALAYQATYYTPTTYAAATPIVASTYAAPAPIYSSRLVSTPHLIPTYAHLIKKRSAILAPAYSSQSRIDYSPSLSSIRGSTLVTSYRYPAFFANSVPILSHGY